MLICISMQYFQKFFLKVWEIIKLKFMKENKSKFSVLVNYGILIKCIDELFLVFGG